MNVSVNVRGQEKGKTVPNQVGSLVENASGRLLCTGDSGCLLFLFKGYGNCHNNVLKLGASGALD